MSRQWRTVADLVRRCVIAVKINVWKYLQTIVMGLYAVCEEKLDNQDRALRQCITSCELYRKDLFLINVIRPKTHVHPLGFLASFPDQVIVFIHWNDWGEAKILGTCVCVYVYVCVCGSIRHRWVERQGDNGSWLLQTGRTQMRMLPTGKRQGRQFL